MLEFFTASQNTPFAVVLGLLLVFLAVELAGLVLGADVSSMLGGGGAADMADAADAGLDTITGSEGLNIGFVTSFLYWLNVGRVPLVILIVLFMTFFVVTGYTVQYILLNATGHMLPAWLATPAALVVAIPAVRWSGRSFAKIVPRDETEAISLDELVGSRAVITIGTARSNSPAQARTVDRFGTTHYVMVEPDDPANVLETGKELLLVRHEGNRFYAIYHPDSI